MIEEAIARHAFSQQSEKTFIDKILGRQDIDSVRELIKKPHMTRTELLEILYLLSSSETKLYNFSEWERYVMMKFFVWIREFIAVAEILYDYQDYLVETTKKKNITITPRTLQLLKNNERLIEHDAKFLIDLYFNISRSSLSVGGMGFMEILKNKYEISYPQLGPGGEGKPKAGVIGAK